MNGVTTPRGMPARAPGTPPPDTRPPDMPRAAAQRDDSGADTPHPAPLETQLAAFLASVRQQTGVPGIAVAVTAEGRRTFASVGVRREGQSAPLTRHATFHLGCITKLLAAIVVLELAADRVLDLEAPLAEYLPELRGSIHGRTATPAHLLSHTAGYRGTQLLEGGTLGWGHTEFIEYLLEAPQQFTPGTVWSYEHSGYGLLGEIVRRVTGRSLLAQIARGLLAPLGVVPALIGRAGFSGVDAGQHVLDPLARRFRSVGLSDLAATGAPPPAPWWESAFSNHAVPLEALLDIAEPLLGQIGASQPCRLPVRSLTLSRLLTPVVALPVMHGGPLAELAPRGFGLGAAAWANGFCGAAGTTFGQCQALRFDPRLGIAIAVGVNAAQPHLRDLVVERITEAVGLGLEGAAHASDAARSARDLGRSWEPELLRGRYLGPGTAEAAATVEGDRLVIVIASGATAMKLRAEVARAPGGGLTVASALPSVSIGFFREPDGTPGLMIGNRAYKRAG